MAHKVSTLILKVDLDCYRCYKKIKKTLSTIQEKEHINSIIYDEKNNTVTISGPFDPKRMIKKLCSKACKVIKDIQIKENKPKETKPAEEKPKEKPAQEKPKEKPKDEEKPKDKPKQVTFTDPVEPKKDKPKAVESVPPPASEPVKNEPHVFEVGPTGYQPVWSAGGPGCYCNPWGYYGNYRGCTCGCAGGYGGPSYRWGPECPPVVMYGTPSCGGGYPNYQTCTFICEEDPQSTCSIM